MSAIEIIELIKALPRKEQEQVKAFARELPNEPQETAGGTMPSEMFQRAKDHVFAHYGPLLEQLAK
jgi:chloramphenicol 3-O-phosphotransferase